MTEMPAMAPPRARDPVSPHEYFGRMVVKEQESHAASCQGNNEIAEIVESGHVAEDGIGGEADDTASCCQAVEAIGEVYRIRSAYDDEHHEGIVQKADGNINLGKWNGNGVRQVQRIHYTPAEEHRQDDLAQHFLLRREAQVPFLFGLDEIIKESQEPVAQGQEQEPQHRRINHLIENDHQHRCQQHEEATHGGGAALDPVGLWSLFPDRLAGFHFL